MHITASQIVEWVSVNAKQAQADLPRWIRRLCSDAEALRQLAFPAGDSTYRPGWDGIVVSESGNAWVPAGTSYWEIGCDKNPTTKANSDYQKRLAQTSPEIRGASTFVFVTPRRWDGKPAWLSDQRLKQDWADVRAYDADDLEQWLEQTPSVALQFAEELGLMGWGVESLSRYWQLWSQQCRPVITPDALFIDRNTTHDRLIEKIRSKLTQPDHYPLVISADSTEEAVGFVVAALQEDKNWAHQSLVVTQPEGWRFVETNRQLKIAIAANAAVANTPSLRSDLLAIIPHALGDLSGKARGDEADVILERPNVYEFEKALVAIGIEESDASRYAIGAGRSWTVLRRQCAINPTIRQPSWLDMPASASLVVPCLLGTWNDDKEADRDIVSRLAAKPYGELEQDLRMLSQQDDAPVLLIGSVWKAKSPLELLNLFGGRITRNQLDRFFEIALEILSTPDPQLELPEEQRYAAQIYGKVHPNSGLLFESLCNTLIKLAVRGPEQPGLVALGIESRINTLIHALLEDATEERWLSLASYLPALAEASPEAFLNAVDRSLRQADAPVTRLLTETSNSGFAGRCWHSGLLWALETLAWAPRQLPRVVLVLARLSHVPIQGNWGNKPSASLFDIFRVWIPQTAADLDGRIRALDLLIEKDPEAAFAVLEGLTEHGPQMATPSARPKWRDDDVGAGNGVPHAEMVTMHEAAQEKIFGLAEGHPSRIASLINNANFRAPDTRSKLQRMIETFTQPSAQDEDREMLRSALRKVIHWHRNYDDTPANELNTWLEEIEKLYARLTPADLVSRHCWLFNSHWVELPNRERDDDISARGNAVSQSRVSALTEIWRARGMAGVEALAMACGEPGVVGSTLAATDFATPEWIAEKGGEFISGQPMTWCVAGLLCSIPLPRSTEFLRVLLSLADQAQWGAEKRARLLILARPEREVWQLATECGNETEVGYWNSVRPTAWDHRESGDLGLVVRRLLDAKRPRTALQCCQHALNEIDAELIFSALQQFMVGEEPDGPLLDSWHIGEMLEHLEQSGAIERMALIQLEFGLFPALGYGNESRAAALYDGVMSEPTLFAELIRVLYKPEHGEREEPVTDGMRAAAECAWRVLHNCARQPGTRQDGTIDHIVFSQFIEDARELCRKDDRLTMCDQTLGQILAYAPVDDDGVWPFLPARVMLDRAEMEEMRCGFAIGVRNKRGVTCRSPLDGGDQERSLAADYRNKAERIRHVHPYVASLLEEIAKSYEHEGHHHDDDANLRKEGY